MFIYLLMLADYFPGIGVLRYLTFRTGAALVTAAVLGFFLEPLLIRILTANQRYQPIRADGPESHLKKSGTPTMGGVGILAAVFFSSLLWTNLTNIYVWFVLGVTFCFGLIGFRDDYQKVKKQTAHGISGRVRLLLEILVAMVVVVYVYRHFGSLVPLPFLKDVSLNLGWLFIPFGVAVIVGTGNAVNLTDGLDGLAIVPVMIAAASFALISYLCGNYIFAHYLQIQYVPGAGEVVPILGAVIGAGLSFLWFNAPPAAIFMGDTGSLALGGMLGSVAVITHHELALGIIGGVFVVEALSVILQVGWYKLTHRRIFAMAPIHHHFEKKGWTESQVVIRFWIIAIMLALVGLSTLKLR